MLLPLDHAFGFRQSGSRLDCSTSIAGLHNFKDFVNRILSPLESEQKIPPLHRLQDFIYLSKGCMSEKCSFVLEILLLSKKKGKKPRLLVLLLFLGWSVVLLGCHGHGSQFQQRALQGHQRGSSAQPQTGTMLASSGFKS